MTDAKADAMIASLTAYDDVAPGTVTPDEGGEGTFDGADRLLDEIPPIEAVPPGVVDEQEEVFEQARQAGESDESGESGGSEGVDEGADFWKRAAEGRRAEIGTLRTKLSEQSQNIEQLRQMWLADAKEKAEAKKAAAREAELQKEAELYGEDVVNDPSTRYVRDKLAQTQEMIERQQQAQYAREQVALEQSKQHQAEQAARDQAMAKLRVYEAELEKTRPDYKQAYDFAVKKRTDMYVKRGYSEADAQQAVMNEEAFLFAEQMQLGNNPAQVAYDLAIEWGWTPEQAQQHADNQVPVNTQRLQAGVQSGGVGRMPGQAGQSLPSDGGTITAEQFFKTVPDAVRLKVLADPDKFEELGRTGKIKVNW